LTVVLFRPARPAAAAVLRADTAVDTPAGPFWIVREDADLLVASKPAGCASHPAHRHSGDTLIDRVRAYLGVKPGDSFQPALANRLDIETSGIVLIGKSPRAQSRLGRGLQKGLLDKFYLTLVGGWPEPEGEIRLPLERHPDSRDLARHRMTGAALPAVKVQEAATRFRVLERLGPPLACSLLEVELLTGRTHQIRRHLTHLGHPLAADRRYGDPSFNADVAAVAGLHRLFLHAARVRLPHPVTGEPLDLRAPLPEDLCSALSALGGRPP
jgi:23S rRNA pseudouridine955/2504/2580 synthase